MGFSFDAGAALGGGLTGLGGITQGILNYESMQKNLRYQKDLQNQIFAREDTSMQRRVADLKAAGLSPVLAAGGSGAGAGSVVATSAPRIEGLDQVGQSIANAAAVKQLEMQQYTIDRTAEETKLIKLQQDKTAADRLSALANARETSLRADSKAMDNKIQRETGLSSNPSVPAKIGRDIYGTIQNFLKPSYREQERANDLSKGPVKKYFDTP